MDFFDKLMHISMNIKTKKGEEVLYTKEIEKCKTLASELKNDAVLYLENWKIMEWESIFEEFVECWEEDLKIKVKHLPEFLEILNECQTVLNEFINDGAENEVEDIDKDSIGKLNSIADEDTEIKNRSINEKDGLSKPKGADETIEDEAEKKDVNASLDEHEEFMKSVWENLRKYKENEGRAFEEINVEVQENGGGCEKSAVEEKGEEEEDETDELLRVVREKLDRFYRQEEDVYRKENVDPLLHKEGRSRDVSRVDPLQDRQHPQRMSHNHTMDRPSQTKKADFSDDSARYHLASASVPSLHLSLEKSSKNPVSESKSGGRVQSAKSILKNSLNQQHHSSSSNITSKRCLNFSHLAGGGAPFNSSRRLIFSTSSSTPYFNDTVQTSSTTANQHEAFHPLTLRKIDKVTFKLTPDYKVISDDSGSLTMSDSHNKKNAESKLFYDYVSFHRDASLNSNRSSIDYQMNNPHGNNNNNHFLKHKTPRPSRSYESLVRKGTGDDYDDDIAALVAPSASSGSHGLSSRFGFKQFYEKKCKSRID